MVRVSVHLHANPPFEGQSGAWAGGKCLLLASLMRVLGQCLVNQGFGIKKRGLYIHFRRI